MYNLIIRPLLFCIDPEKVHRMLLSWLKFYRYLFPVRACVRGYSRVSDPFSYGHLQFKNRIGLSAGFDKNAEAFDELADSGFGFLEVGTVTPDSQSGNPSPRIFRLVDDESLISRTGMLKEGATSFWEKYNPEETGTQHLAMYGRPYGKSLCHAWGASPIYLLGKYYLGVKPVKEGYKEFAIAPVLGGLKWMEGTVPTPNGNIHVYMNSKTMKVKATEGKGYLTIKSRRPPKANIGTPEKVSEGIWRLWIDSPEERIVTYHL